MNWDETHFWSIWMENVMCCVNIATRLSAFQRRLYIWHECSAPPLHEHPADMQKLREPCDGSQMFHPILSYTGADGVVRMFGPNVLEHFMSHDRKTRIAVVL